LKKLIVNADDLGQSRSINKGIADCQRFGIVTSASLMVNMHDSVDAVRLLKNIPNIGIGLHLNLTFGPPVSSPQKIGSLVGENGQFIGGTRVLSLPPDLRKSEGIRKVVDLMLEDFHKTVSKRDIETEMLAQFHRFMKLVGRLPTHIDTHHHIHQLPEVLHHIITLAKDNDIPVRQIDPNMVKILRKSSIRTTDYFFDTMITEANRRRSHSLYLNEIISSLKDGTTEVLCHPGYSSEKLRKQTLYSNQRQVELECLCDSLLMKRIKDEGVQLITYDEL